VLLVEQPEPTISYRTGWVVYEESLTKDNSWARVERRGFVNFYDGRLNPSDYPMPEAFSLEIDGQLLASDWKWAGLERTTQAREPARCDHAKKRCPSGHGQSPYPIGWDRVLTRWLEVTNTGTRRRRWRRPPPGAGDAEDQPLAGSP